MRYETILNPNNREPNSHPLVVDLAWWTGILITARRHGWYGEDLHGICRTEVKYLLTALQRANDPEIDDFCDWVRSQAPTGFTVGRRVPRAS